MTIATAEITSINVKMGGIDYCSAPGTLTTLLGSCVGVAIWDQVAKVGGLAHIVLPDSAGRQAGPGKFADTAIAEIKRRLLGRGANPRHLAAKIAGGATMFGKRTERDVGAKNHLAVVKHLKEQAIRLLAEEVGGSKGRMVSFSPDDGSLAVFIARKLVTTI